ncbi:hypothetical protein MKW98_027672 [Papaver atlanticum]|uniref:Cytochrome P450 n=1 Tax=Papaver atlanticum TaxID=357466 RepID=A0AAD4XLF1_9MAGN|nr:hypothetical protein MKW98_027672 [Papaver atlanticum]
MVDFIYQYFPFASIAGLFACISFFYYLWISVLRQRNMKTRSNHPNDTKLSQIPPPEVRGAWPIIGHLPQLAGSKPLFKILGDMADKYGSIFMVRFGMYPTLVVSSWEMSKECYTVNDKFLASRPPTASGKYLGYDFAMVGFAFYGPYWQEMRKISTLQLLSHKRLELLKHVTNSEIENCIKKLYQGWMKSQNQIKHKAATSASVKVDMTRVFGDLTLNTVLKLVVGKALYTEDDNENEKEESQKFHETISEFFRLAGVTVASDALPFLGRLDVDGQKKQMKRIAKEMDLIAEKWLQEHRERKRPGTLSYAAADTSNDENDFMDVLVSVLDEEKDNLFFDYSRDTAIKATCLALTLAASDTTSVSMTWALSLLLTNPSVLRKAQEELDTVVGKGRNIQEHDINDLVYLQAIIKETLRLYPAGPLSIPHEAIEDCNIGGYKVKAGTRLLVNLWKLHRDPRVWSNPLEFKPERFLSQLDGSTGGEAANLDFKGQNFEYTPFGSGRRMCPGINLAIQTLHMTLACLLHAFDFDIPAGLVIDMAEGSGLTMPKVTPLEVHLYPRLPSSASTLY